MAVLYLDSNPQPAITFVREQIYRFDQANASNAGMPLSISTTEDGENNGGTPYTTGVSYWLNNLEVNRSSYLSGFANATSRFLQIEVAPSAPNTLYYYGVGTPDAGGTITVTG